MVRERADRSGRRSNSFSRRSILQSTAGIGIGTAFGAAPGAAQSSVEEWGSSCDDAPVVDGTGSYSGTIETPDDEHYFKVQVDHGEYLEIDLSVPSTAEEPSLSIESPDSEAYTKRNPNNVSFEASRWGEWIEIEPGLDGSFELWAEEDTVFCFQIYDGSDDGEYPYDWTFDSALSTSAEPSERWGDSCEDGPVVDATGTYTPTLVSPADDHYFKMQVDHGEYLEIDLSAPSSAEEPSLSIESPDSEAYTKRNPNNVSFEANRWGEWIEIEPGLDGSFELWAEEDTVFCFKLYDGGLETDLPCDLTFDSERLTSAEPSDRWGDSCEGAPVVETTGEYTGTIVSPDEQHFLRFVMEEGETLNVATSVPGAAEDPSLSIESPDSEAYTKRNPNNVSFEASRWGEWIEVESGLDGSFELVAESGSRFCLSVYDGSTGSDLPFDWTLAFNQDLSAGSSSGSITGELRFSDGLLDEPVANPVTVEVTATGASESRSVERVIDASTDTSPVEYAFDGLPVGEYQLTASVVSVGGETGRSDEVAVDTDYDAVAVEGDEAVSGYDFGIEKTTTEGASLSISEFDIDDRSSAGSFPVDLLLAETAGVPTDDLDVTLSIESQRGNPTYESTVSVDPLDGGATIVTFGEDGSTAEVGPFDGDAIAYEAAVVAEAANADPVRATETFRVARASETTHTATDTSTGTTTQPPTTESTRTRPDTAAETTVDGDTDTATEENEGGTTSGSGPGFGVGGVLSAIGGTGYLLKRRLESEDRD